jgi:hypothetical protein
MENIRIFIDELDGTEHAIIEHADGSFTSMHKSTYDELKAADEAASE